MPDTIPGDTTEASLAVADALLSVNQQTTMSEKPDVSPEREAELDATFQQITGETAADAAPKPAEPAPDKPADKVPDKPTAPDPVPAPVEDKGRKGLLGDLLPDTKTPASADATQKAFDEVKLRSDASPKTQETFQNLKNIAQAQIAEARQKAETIETERVNLEKQLNEIKQQVGKPTPEIESELKDLREFRALHDVTSRPEFKEKFDSKIEANYGEIYGLLTQEGLKPEALTALKGMSEEARLAYVETNVLPSLTPGQRRFVEAKILANVNIQEEKTKAVSAARADADKIIAEQRGEPARQEQQRIQTMSSHLKSTLMKLEFFHPKEIPSTATDAQKKELEAFNATALSLQESMRNAVLDNSPEARAESALAVPLAKYYKGQYSAALARAEKAEGQLASIQKASATGRRLGQSAAPAGAAPAAKPANTNDDSGDALDNLFRTASAELAR